LAAVVALCVAAAMPAAAQEPDSVTVDSIPAPADSFVVVDSIPEPAPGGDTAAVAETPPAPHALIEIPAPGTEGVGRGVWEWDRDELMRSTALTLADLLSRVPSLTRVRAGYYPAPELVVGPAAIGGDVEVFLDGYRVDPLVGSTLDLSQFALANLQRVRAERRGGRLRVELTTLAWADERPYTVVEAATGDLDTQALRGVFAAPDFLFGPIAVGAERLDAEGTGARDPGNVGGWWLKWGVLRERWSVYGELRQFGADRGGQTTFDDTAVPRFAGETRRRDAVLRARARPWPFLAGELYVGRSDLDQELADTLENGVTQAGALAALTLPWIESRSALRLRDDAEVAPSLSAETDVAVTLLDRLELDGRAWWESWEGEAFVGLGARASLELLFGLSPFVEWSDGEHGVPQLDPASGEPLGVSRTTLRAGAEWGLGGWALGAAGLLLEGDGVARAGVPGLWHPGPRRLNLYPGFDVEGIEAWGRLPLPVPGFALTGDYTHLRPAGDAGLTLFQPSEQTRLALAYHGLPLDGDQLEIDGRISFEFRGTMLAPDDPVGRPVLIEPIQSWNLDLSIRVVQVRAFVRWENILHELDQQDVPGRLLPGQHAYFGVKWELWN